VREALQRGKPSVVCVRSSSGNILHSVWSLMVPAASVFHISCGKNRQSYKHN